MPAHVLSSMPRWRWLAALSALCCASCSGNGDLPAVRGKVLYQDQPLAGVLVTLHPLDEADLAVVRPQGLTADDGTFALTSGEQAGAAAGRYSVTFVCYVEVPSKKKQSPLMGAAETADRFRGAYAEKSASKITVEIEPGDNQLESFNLK